MERTSPIECLRPETLTWTQAESMSQLRGRAEGHSLCTIENYAYTMCQAIPFFCSRGADRPAAVTSVHVKEYLDQLRSAGQSTSTVATRFRHLRTFFRFLSADGLLAKDPTDRVAKPRIESKAPKAFRLEDFQALLKKIPTGTQLGKRDAALFCLLFDSGARLSEVLALTIEVLDFAQNLATVRGKGGRSRLITWGDRTRRLLIEWLRCRSDAKAGDFLFCDIYGGPLTRNAVRLRLKRLTKKAGISAPRFGAHAMRHGCAVELLRGGADVETVRRTLGHSRLTTTQGYLRGLSEEEALSKARSVGVVDRLASLPGKRSRVIIK